jgi:[protein-PII] uridylyltransferase
VVLHRVEPGVAIATYVESRDGNEVTIGPGADPATDPSLPVRLAAVAAERSLPIARDALEAFSAQSPVPDEPWSDELRASFIRVLAAGQPAITALEALDHYGLLVRLLPEWAAVRNRPQRNAYHRFTVDRHLLEAAAQAAPLAFRVARPDLLLVAVLLHDIGKGHRGDHTDAGVEIVATVAHRMGFSAADTATLVQLVRHHLLLAEVATRRDLDDPATVDAVAAAVGDRSTLELLAALTEADSLATSSAAWGPWKAGLVADLVRRTGSRLAGDTSTPPAPSLVTDRHRGFMRQAAALGRSIVVADIPHVTVVAPDRPGLLAAVTGVLALRGLDVRSANVASEGGYAVEIFVVEAARGQWPDWELVSDEVDAVRQGRLALEERLATQARAYAGVKAASSPHPVTTQVSVDNGASSASTVVEVRARDAPGLLHRITTALFQSDLDVVAARVSTLGHEVVDAFYVRDRATGGKVTDSERMRLIDQSVRAAAAEPAS